MSSGASPSSFGDDYVTRATTALSWLTEMHPLQRLRALFSSGPRAAARTDDDAAERSLPSSCRLLFETTPDPVLIADAESGTILTVNDATVGLLGWSRRELQGASITRLHPSGEEHSYRRLFEDHARSAEDEAVTLSRLPSGAQIYVETRSNEQIPVEINARVFEADDRPVITGVFRDVTERRRRERELETFKAAVENAGHSIYWTDREGTIEYVNPAFEETTGYPADAAVGRNPRLLRSGVHDRAFYSETWETILDGAVWQGEIVNERADGERFVVDQTIAPVGNGDGQVERFVAINSDITHRRKRERELQEFKRAVEQVGLAVFITDVDGTIEYVNPAFERITGYDGAAAIGRTPSILNSGQKDAAYFRDLWETVRSGETWQEEIVNRRADDTSYHALQTVSPVVDEDGDPRKFVAVQRDISDIKAFEAELERQNERLERFASVVSHDLRNPLTVAQGRLELALREHDSDHLQAVDRSLDRMAALIEDLLELTREKAGAPALETVDLSHIARESWQTVDTDAATVQIRAERAIRADSARVRRALENLFRNAVEHGSTSPQSSPPGDAVEHGNTSPQSSPPGDAVEHGTTSPRSHAHEDAVEHGSTSPQSSPPGDAVEHGTTSPRSHAHDAVEQGSQRLEITVGTLADGFYVEDDGVGIDESERDAVVSEGYSTGGGTGLGLSIVKSCADAHDWELSITEGSTGGARFEFTGVELA